jgi:broad specificity phosphatase PhoE
MIDRRGSGSGAQLRALWVVRHAQSEGNVADDRARDARAERLTLDVRDPDVELSVTGIRQAEALGTWIGGLPDDERPTAVVSSPYVRAARTANLAVAAAGGTLSVRHDERLRERDLGAFDGYTGVGITAAFPDEADRRQRLGKFYYRPPGGESWADVALRIRSFLMSLRTEFTGERVLVFTHQAVAMVLRYVVEELSEREVLDLDASYQIANCALTSYDDVGGRLELTRFNEVGHLRNLDEPVTKEPDAATVA